MALYGTLAVTVGGEDPSLSLVIDVLGLLEERICVHVRQVRQRQDCNPEEAHFVRKRLKKDESGSAKSHNWVVYTKTRAGCKIMEGIESVLSFCTGGYWGGFFVVMLNFRLPEEAEKSSSAVIVYFSPTYALPP